MLAENNNEEAWSFILKEFTDICQENDPFVSGYFELWGGAIAKVAPDATAFAYRTPLYNLGIFLMLPVDEKYAEENFHLITEKVNKVWAKISMYLKGTYANYPMDTLPKDKYAAAYWGDNLERLQSINAKYDPRTCSATSSQCLCLGDTFPW